MTLPELSLLIRSAIILSTWKMDVETIYKKNIKFKTNYLTIERNVKIKKKNESRKTNLTILLDEI